MTTSGRQSWTADFDPLPDPEPIEEVNQIIVPKQKKPPRWQKRPQRLAAWLREREAARTSQEYLNNWYARRDEGNAHTPRTPLRATTPEQDAADTGSIATVHPEIVLRQIRRATDISTLERVAREFCSQRQQTMKLVDRTCWRCAVPLWKSWFEHEPWCPVSAVGFKIAPDPDPELPL